MMIHRRSEERGHENLGWLDTRFSFSFASYHDPEFMGFRHLRVINEDVIQPGKGFGTHPHRNMEIVSIILSGEIEHKDSMGNSTIIKAGEVQRMTAGTGIFHSEFNPSSERELKLLQIWLLPNAEGLTPSYEQRHYSAEEYKNKLKLVISPDQSEGSMAIHQDVKIYRSQLDSDQKLDYEINSKRHVWIQMISGELEANGQKISQGDGLALSNTAELNLVGLQNSDFLLFDLN